MYSEFCLHFRGLLFFHFGLFVDLIARLHSPNSAQNSNCGVHVTLCLLGHKDETIESSVYLPYWKIWLNIVNMFRLKISAFSSIVQIINHLYQIILICLYLLDSINILYLIPFKYIYILHIYSLKTWQKVTKHISVNQTKRLRACYI